MPDINDTMIADFMADPMSETGATLRTIIDAKVRDMLAELLGYILPPAEFPGFARLPMPRVTYKAATETFEVDADYSSLIPTGGVTYYVAPDAPTTGNDGLTPASPIIVGAAIGKADVGEIRYAPGEYFRDNHARATDFIGRDIRHIAAGAGVRLSGFNRPRALTWTLSSGSIYQTTRTAAQRVFDAVNLTPEGDFQEYARKADLASITAEGQYAIVGSIVYVWPIGSTNMTTTTGQDQMRVQVTARTGVATDASTQYVEGITFEGSTLGGLRTSGTGLIIAKDSAVKYAPANGVFSTGGAMILDHVTVARSGADGFNYHVYAPATYCDFLEIGCVSRNNGQIPGATTNNATTAHETAVGIRVNGTYSTSHGPVLADVNQAKTWNLGCTSGESTTAALSQSSAYRVDATGYTEDQAAIWLDLCEAHDVDKGLHATGGGQIIHRDTAYAAVTTPTATATGGTIEPYATAG